MSYDKKKINKIIVSVQHQQVCSNLFWINIICWTINTHTYT